ncbi:casein kinase I isoform gamma-3-like protein, partial [Leptotrombidium deliense]
MAEDKDKEFKELVNDKFKVGKKIGAGSFGELRLGENVETKEAVAIKFEPRKVKGPTLPQEYKFYEKVGEAEGIPKILYFGHYGKFNVMVMELLWKSLQDCFEWAGKKLSVKTVIQVALQMITRIETVHQKGLVYRDIKPENFLFGKQPKQKILYLIDFGLAKEYLDKEGKHIKYKEGKSLTGTARYMSINTHQGKEQSRRDDLEAIGYVLMYFLRGNLPWMKLKCNDKKTKYKLIGETKEKVSVDELCAGFPEEFATY